MINGKRKGNIKAPFLFLVGVQTKAVPIAGLKCVWLYFIYLFIFAFLRLHFVAGYMLHLASTTSSPLCSCCFSVCLSKATFYHSIHSVSALRGGGTSTAPVCVDPDTKKKTKKNNGINVESVRSRR